MNRVEQNISAEISHNPLPIGARVRANTEVLLGWLGRVFAGRR